MTGVYARNYHSLWPYKSKMIIKAKVSHDYYFTFDDTCVGNEGLSWNQKNKDTSCFCVHCLLLFVDILNQLTFNKQ